MKEYRLFARCCAKTLTFTNSFKSSQQPVRQVLLYFPFARWEHIIIRTIFTCGCSGAPEVRKMMEACLPFPSLPRHCPPSLFHPYSTSWHQKLCPFPKAAGTNYHPLDSFKQQKCVFTSSGGQESKSRCWWDQALSRGFRGGAIPSLASSSAGTCLHSLAPARISLCYIFTLPFSLSESPKPLSIHLHFFLHFWSSPFISSPLSWRMSLSQQDPFHASIPTITSSLNLNLQRRVAFRSNLRFILVASYHTAKGSFSVQMKMGFINEECRGRQRNLTTGKNYNCFHIDELKWLKVH